MVFVCWFRPIGGDYMICKPCNDKRLTDVNVEFEYNTKNILLLFDEFKEKNWNKTEILSNDKFLRLTIHLEDNLNPYYWLYTLLGFNRKSEFVVPIMLTHEQVKILLDIVGQNDMTYKYVHALGPNVLLVEQAREINTVFRYYPGKTKDEIINTWSSKYRWLYNCDQFVIDNCPICLNDISLSMDYVICKCCKKMSHANCKFEYLASTNSPKCELCRSEYTGQDDIEIIYADGTNMDY